jgi:hypothetical protein
MFSLPTNTIQDCPLWKVQNSTSFGDHRAVCITWQDKKMLSGQQTTVQHDTATDTITRRDAQNSETSVYNKTALFCDSSSDGQEACCILCNFFAASSCWILCWVNLKILFNIRRYLTNILFPARIPIQILNESLCLCACYILCQSSFIGCSNNIWWRVNATKHLVLTISSTLLLLPHSEL